MRRNAALFVLVFMTLTSAGRGDAACALKKLASLPIAADDNRIVVDGAINGKPAQFMIDTAVAHSFILAPAAADYGLPVDGPIITRRPHAAGKAYGLTSIDDLRLGGLAVGHASLFAIGQRENFGGKKLVAILGNDFLSRFDVEIDIKAAQLTLFERQPDACADANLAYWTDHYNVAAIYPGVEDARPARPERNAVAEIVVHAQIDGRDMRAVLDSGSAYSTLTYRAAERLGVHPDSAGVAQAGDGRMTPPTDFFTLYYELGMTPLGYNVEHLSHNAGPVEYRPGWLGSFASFTLDQEVIRPARLQFRQFAEADSMTGSTIKPVQNWDMLLGVDFLRAHRLLIAYSQDKAYFSYVGGPPFQSMERSDAGPSG